MKFKPANERQCSSLQGYVDVSYATLVEVFGEPHCDGDGYKVDAEWVLTFEDGTYATIYNYKDGPNYNEGKGCVKEITDWHVGGDSTASVERVSEALNVRAVSQEDRYPRHFG